MARTAERRRHIDDVGTRNDTLHRRQRGNRPIVARGGAAITTVRIDGRRRAARRTACRKSDSAAAVTAQLLNTRGVRVLRARTISLPRPRSSREPLR
jgi:hypothetical protein